MSNAAKFEVPGVGDDGQVYAYNEVGDAFALTDLAALYQPLDSDLTAIAALTTTPFGRGLLALANAAALRAAADVDQAGTAASLIASHEADTTSVHGIADTSVLATDSDVSSAVSTHAAAVDPHGDRAYADSAVSALSTVYQPLDSDLTAIAALTTTLFGRSLLALADAAALRSAAGLVIGTDVQAFSSVLAATTASFTTALESKLNGIEAAADVTDETNVLAALSGATTTGVTPASGDKFLVLDASDSDNIKHVLYSDVGGGGAPALDDLTDVTITTPSTGQVLKYNGTGWVNDTDATAGGTTALDDLSDVTITAAASGDILRHNGTAWVDTPGTDHFEAAGAVSTHSADTTSVHGIADTSALATATDVSTAVSNHSADTTSVHGIADTSALLDTSDIGVSVQAQDAELSAIAGLTSAADRLPYFTGSGTASLATFTAAGRALVDDADNTAQRATLGLVIGTDVQAHSAVLDATTASFTTADETKLDGIEAGATADMSAAEILAALLTVDGFGSGLDADLLDGQSSASFATSGHDHSGVYQPAATNLTALSGLTSAADKLPYFTGSGTAAVADLTSFARTILDDADAASTRGTLNAVARINGGVETFATNSTATGSVTVDLANGNLHALTLTGNVTSLTLSGTTASRLCSLTLVITQDATGGRSITWPASVKWLPSGSAPTFTTTLSTVSVVEMFTIDNGTTWYAGLAGTGIS